MVNLRLTIKVRKTRDNKLKLLSVEDTDKILADYVMESAEERVDLLFDALIHLVVSELLHIL